MELQTLRARGVVLCAAALMLGALMLGACAGARQVDQNAPTVTYEYTEGEFGEASEKADDYCADEYNRKAELVSRNDADGEATFACTDELEGEGRSY
jgi:hypothetical protein